MTIELSLEDLELLLDALDNHRYGRQSDDLHRHDGMCWNRGATNQPGLLGVKGRRMSERTTIEQATLDRLITVAEDMVNLMKCNCSYERGTAPEDRYDGTCTKGTAKRALAQFMAAGLWRSDGDRVPSGMTAAARERMEGREADINRDRISEENQGARR